MNEEEKKKIFRMIKWSLGLKPGPLRVDLILTNKCNQKCGYCYLREHKTDTENELTIDEIIRIIKEGSQLGVYNWNLMGGGEPMFNQPKLIVAMREIKKRGMFGNITTNGTLFNKQIIKEIVQMGWDCINFSVDSSREEIQDKLRGQKGALRKAELALEQFKQIKTELKKTKPNIVIHSVITRMNYNHLKELMCFAKEKGANKLEFTQVMSFSRFAKKIRLTPQETEKFKELIPGFVSFSKKIGLKTNIQEYITGELIEESEKMDNLIKREVENYKIKLNCFNPWTSLMILNNGDVGPCCLYTPDKKIGNIRKSSLRSIWLGKKLKLFRKKMRKNDILSCKNCPSTEVIRNKSLREKLENNIIFNILQKAEK